jgi:hypothetical protein
MGRWNQDHYPDGDREAGFELEASHADWTGAEFTAESRSHVSVYRIPRNR